MARGYRHLQEYEKEIIERVEKGDTLGDYIHFYNYQRIQLKTKLTLMEYRCQFVA